MGLAEHALACARAGVRLLRCLVAPPRAPAPPPLEHEWRPRPGLTLETWEYLHRGERLAFIHRLSELELADLNKDHERMGLHGADGFRPWHEGFLIEWEPCSELRSDCSEPGSDPLPHGPSISYCNTFERARTLCRIHAQVFSPG